MGSFSGFLEESKRPSSVRAFDVGLGCVQKRLGHLMAWNSFQVTFMTEESRGACQKKHLAGSMQHLITIRSFFVSIGEVLYSNFLESLECPSWGFACHATAHHRERQLMNTLNKKRDHRGNVHEFQMSKNLLQLCLLLASLQVCRAEASLNLPSTTSSANEPERGEEMEGQKRMFVKQYGCGSKKDT